MNRLYATTCKGTIGELIVQLHLLQYDVQAAPPIKDSGNDLIAVRKRTFRAIQVKTTTTNRIIKPDVDVLYHILAVVHLPVINGRYCVRDAEVFVFPERDVARLSTRLSDYPHHRLSPEWVERLFPCSDKAELHRSRWLKEWRHAPRCTRGGTSFVW
jgi:hypothetical protein